MLPASLLLQVGMGNADYLAAFLHVLLPLAFEVTVWWVSPRAGYPRLTQSPTVKAGELKAIPSVYEWTLGSREGASGNVTVCEWVALGPPLHLGYCSFWLLPTGSCL